MHFIVFILLILSHTIFAGEHALHDFNHITFLKTHFVALIVVYPGECSTCTLRRMYILLLLHGVFPICLLRLIMLQCYSSPLFFFFFCLLILYLLVSIIKSGILNYRVAIYFSLQLCQCLVICLGALILLNAYIFIIVISG